MAQIAKPATLFTNHSSANRFAFVDGLRGIAALGVVIYHISRYGSVAAAAAHVTPDWLALLLKHGWVGVQMFFVMSGFVIAYSLRNALVTPAFVAHYAVRRSLRLDPAYWLTIALAIIVDFGLLTFAADPALDANRPTWPQLAAHLGYLQNVLGYGNLSAGFWTLCIEVQFYLLFVILLGLAQALAQRLSERRPQQQDRTQAILAAALTPLALASLFVFHLDRQNDNWLIHFFCMFFFGMLAWWALDGRISPHWFWGFSLALVGRLVWVWNLDLAVALTTGLAIYTAGRVRRLDVWLGFGWLQYLGRISYSLYLVHYPISRVVTAIGYSLTGDAPVAAVGWLLLALAASIGAAQALYLAVEAPSIRWSKLSLDGGWPALPSLRPLTVSKRERYTIAGRMAR